MIKPSCFVIMPFGKKEYKVKGAKKTTPPFKIDFNTVYDKLIEPAIKKAGMTPIRADREKIGGTIHKPMFERIILCDYVVTDMTGANANVFYELGIRHAVKPFTTVPIFNDNTELPFDVNLNRAMPYSCDKKGKIANLEKSIVALTAKLKEAKTNKVTDSPIYQLVDGIQFQNSVAHEKTDVFRDEVTYNEELKKALREARGKKGEAEKAIDEIVAKKLKPLHDQETGVLIDVMLSYRAAGALEKMVKFIESLPIHIQQTVMVQEQYGFGLNRLKRRDEAVTVLENVLKKNGPSSETYGILGRVYKDWFDEHSNKDAATYNEEKAAGYLNKAVDTYRKGFEADWRDAYPGINAVTLSALKGDEASIKQLAPVVEYSVLRKMATKTPDYWDYATLLELCVINNDKEKAGTYLQDALATNPESWMPASTAKNLLLIKKYRQARGEDVTLIDKITASLK